MKNKRIYKIVALFVLIIVNFTIVSFAENTKELNIKIDYKYDKETNTVIAIMNANNQLADTKPTWSLSSNKLTYTKKFDSNISYSTPVQDIYGNVIDVEIVVEGVIIPEITVEYKYNTNGKITAIMKSNIQLKNTKPTWNLSNDKLFYEKEFNEEITYSTPVETIYGNIINVNLKVKAPNATIETSYIYNQKDNKITAMVKSNVKLKDTKPTWKLSSDQLSYIKEFEEEMTYSTPVETIYGEIINVRLEIKKSDFNIKINYDYNQEESKVIVTIISNTELKDTKPTWMLSEDRLSYTKIFYSNIKYSTPLEDIYGNVINANIEITKLTPKVLLNYSYNSNNTLVTVTMNSSAELKDTKPTWRLSEDKLSYTKTFEINSIYSTPVEDLYGNIVEVKIEITKLIPKITMEYIYNNDNTVTAIMHSNCQLEDTKPTWELDKDKVTYTKLFNTNEDYFTPVQDIYGNIATVHIFIRIKGNINIDSIKYPGYQEKLQDLIKKHPNWNFELLYTGLTLDEAVKGECSLHSRNLVPSSYSGEWVCSICGTKLYDSGWYCASEKAVAYYMDSRNFLDETNIFQFLELNEYNSNSVSLNGIQTKVNGSFLQNYSEAINNACRNTNVNPYYIIARLLQEQGYSGTKIGTGMNGRRWKNIL